MKLTKGKLSKLFHKKKQTMRRYKNQRKYRRASKTFRQRKPLNLHRSSMKKFVDPRKIEWIGGTEPDEKVPLVVKPASDEATTSTPIMEPVPEPVSEPESVPIPEPESMPTPTSEPAPEPAPEPEPESAPTSTPTAEPESAPATATESEQAPSSEEVPETKMEPEIQMEATKVDAIPTADAVPKQMDAENVKPESSVPPSVADALNLIADKIATAVVNKMRENPASGSSSNQDADIAVPLAVSAVVKQTQLAPE